MITNFKVKNVFLLVLVFTLSISQIKSQKTDKLIQGKKIVLFKNWALDLNQLKLIGINDYSTKEIIWDVNKEPSYWGDKNKIGLQQGDFIPVKRKDSTINYIKVEEIISNNVIYGYKITCWDISKKLKLWSYSDTLHGIATCAKVISCDNKLFIATFDIISTGSGLVCFNEKTGELYWNGDVKQMLISHSEYSNDVFLNKIDDFIVLVGDEAGGKYIQVFNAKTGENIFSELKMNW
jgi:outer membrane protein assembly factor BamB